MKRLSIASIPHSPALYVEPNEPPTRTLTETEANAVLERDYLSQAEDKPLAARAVEEIRWARELAARLMKNPKTPDLKPELSELDAPEKRSAGILSAGGQDARATYLAVAPRKPPPAIPDRVVWPGTGANRQPPEPGVFFSADVYEGVPDLPRGSVRFLRVIQQDAKTYSTWTRDARFSGPSISILQEDAVKRILGTVPVEADGSVHFKVPPGRALFFRPLDEHGRALQTMRSFTGVMPGERRGCVGCHELSSVTPPSKSAIALRRPPSELTPPPWGTQGISYERLVQPVLDRYCGSCHQGNGEARAKLDLTLRPGHGPFKEPYVTLVGWAQYSGMSPTGKPGIAGAILCENCDQSDPNAYVTFRPMKHLSYTSQLIEIAMSGKHYNVQVDPLSLQQLIAWVDANCPYRGEEDVRAIPDPIIAGLPIQPRCKTAPAIERP